MINKCTCSKYCRVHSDKRCATIEYGYNGYGVKSGEIIYSIHPSTNKEAKNLLCQIINDKAIDKICLEHSLMIDCLHEMEFQGNNKCIGMNKNKNKIYISLRNNKGKFLHYTDIIAVLLHELVHHTYSEHNSDFINIEKKYRKKYIKYARNTGTIPPWIDIKFPNSSGKFINIHEIDFNSKNTSRLSKKGEISDIKRELQILKKEFEKSFDNRKDTNRENVINLFLLGLVVLLVIFILYLLLK